MAKRKRPRGKPKTLTARVNELESRVQAIWTLLRTLFVLTQRNTEITPEHLTEILKTWKNQAPPDSTRPELAWAMDQTAMDVMPELERLIAELSEVLQNMRRRTHKTD